MKIFSKIMLLVKMKINLGVVSFSIDVFFLGRYDARDVIASKNTKTLGLT